MFFLQHFLTCKKNTFIEQQWKNYFVSASFRIVEFWFVTEYPGLIKIIIRNTVYFILHNLNCPTKEKYSLQENSHTSYETKSLSRKITQPDNTRSSVKSKKGLSLRRLVHTNLYKKLSIFLACLTIIPNLCLISVTNIWLLHVLENS